MNDSYDLAPYTRSFFEDHLVRRRNLSRNSVWSYRDAIKLLIQFASKQTGRSVSMLHVKDIDEPLVLRSSNTSSTNVAIPLRRVTTG